MKTIITTLLLLISIASYSQTGILMDRYYISGSLSVGKEDRSYADSSAWLQLGEDTTAKGLAFPKVLLDSVRTVKRALFVYDLKDSVLYHFDGTKRVKYMTYKDTVLVKQLITENLPDLTPFIQKVDTTRDGYISTTYYTDSLANTKMSYQDTLEDVPTKSFLLDKYFMNGGNSFNGEADIGTNNNESLNLITNSQPRLSIFNNGNISIGSVNDEGYKLDVNGELRVAGDMYLDNTLTFKSFAQGIRIYDVSSPAINVSILIGKNNGTYPNPGNRQIRVGFDNSGAVDKIWQIAFGHGNNLSAAGNSAFTFGNFNTIQTTEKNLYALGESNIIDFSWSGTSRGQFVIGYQNQVHDAYSSILGNHQETTGANQLIIADANPNTSSGGYRDVYFGSGPVSNMNGGFGAPVTINSSGGKGDNKPGGLLRLAAGKSTGNTMSPDLIFATASITSSGLGLQTLTDRWYVKGETGYLSDNIAPTSKLDIEAASGYNQLRLRSTYTPTSTADTNGNAGDVAWDDDYIYIKTSAGWKRTALSTF